MLKNTKDEKFENKILENYKAVEWAKKVLRGEYSQREASALSKVSRYKISKAMKKIIEENKGKNPFN